jgi:hypothetical protein
MAAANLVNEAIYDTTLAIVPRHSSRIQPCRAMSLGAFTLLGIYTQMILEIFEQYGAVDTYCLPLFMFFHRIESMVIMPLLFLNSLCQNLAKMGSHDDDESGAEPAVPMNPIRMMRAKIPSPAQLGLLYDIFINPVTSRIVLFVLNLVLMIFSCCIVVMGFGCLDPRFVVFFNQDFVILFIVGGVFMFFVSLLGFAGGASESVKYLLPYSIIIAVTLLFQIMAISYGKCYLRVPPCLSY